ncbi:MBL fold metallo-hydrolase [Azospirillum palustre]
MQVQEYFGRAFKKAIWRAALLTALFAGGSAMADEMRVTLLGTGSPNPNPQRFSQSTLIEAGTEKLVFDLGRGVTIRLAQKKVPFGAITAHFLTHMHSDHFVGLPDLLLTGRIQVDYASRKTPMVLYGPKGTTAMAENLIKAFEEDIRIRTEDEHLPLEAVMIDAHDIVAGEVYNKNGVKVTAFDVNHGEHIRPSYGYVVEYGGRKVVMSGDTKYDERVANMAKGADLLIHEVADIDPALEKQYPGFKQIMAHHTRADEAGKVFTIARPKLAVFSHVIVRAEKPQPGREDEIIMTGTRQSYQGPVIVGKDLMSFVIADDVTAYDAGGVEIKAEK